MNILRHSIPRAFATCKSRPFSSLRRLPSTRPAISTFPPIRVSGSRQRDECFSSKAPGQQQPDPNSKEATQSPKKKTTRSPAAKHSLRRVAVEAQRSRDGKEPRRTHPSGYQTISKVLFLKIILMGWAGLILQTLRQ